MYADRPRTLALTAVQRRSGSAAGATRSDTDRPSPRRSTGRPDASSPSAQPHRSAGDHLAMMVLKRSTRVGCTRAATVSAGRPESSG